MSSFGQSQNDYEPGYPIDRRRAQQLVRLAKDPIGDFESRAARVVARLTGERVILEDDGSRAGMADIRIEYANGRPAYAEVWTDIQPRYAATWSRLRGPEGRLPKELSLATLRRDWFVTLSGATDLRRFEVELEALFAGLEARGATFEWVTDLATLESSPDPGVGRLVELGVVELSSRSADSSRQGVVRLYPAGIVGPSVVDWEAVLDWIADTAASPRLADVRKKLARTKASERHLFVGLTFTSPGEVFFALSIEEQTLPPEPPRLPDEITHLWLMHAFSPGRCLAWFPDRGWLDVMWHWATC